MNKPHRPKARVAKGFRDIGPDEIRGIRQMLAKIERVYESYGFEPVEQPFIEYTDALGKFLPDQDRPNAGVCACTAHAHTCACTCCYARQARSS